MTRAKFVRYKPISVVRSPYKDASQAPRQPLLAGGDCAQVRVEPRYRKGLADLEGFSHVILICHLHRSKKPSLIVRPPMDDRPHGLFATRSPHRPNPIGLSVVRLGRIAGNTLHVSGVDILDGTPLLDIKPYIPDVPADASVRLGWVDRVRAQSKRRTKPDKRS